MVDQNYPRFDPRIQTEKLSFDPDELIACGCCGRMNAPNRLKCLYCAGLLDIKLDDPLSIKTSRQRLELWKHGYSVIFQAADATATLEKIAQFLSMETSDLESIIGADTPLPLARVESEKEAAILETVLKTLGVKCSLISDDDLDANRPPVRLRGIDIRNGCLALQDFNTGKTNEIAAHDLVLIVAGMITSGRIDSLEKKGHSGKTKLIDESATTSDEAVIDVYRRQEPLGFRINMAGFDFSCLDNNKGLLASENMRLFPAF